MALRLLTFVGVLSTAAAIAATEPGPLPVGDSPSQTISLHFDEAEVSSVLRFLAEAADLNIIAGSEVSGTVSINLKNVTVREAMDGILGILGFTHFRKGNIIYVTTEAGKRALPQDLRDLEVRTYQLDYVKPEDVLETVKALLSESGEAWEAPGRFLVIRDSPSYFDGVTNFLYAVDIPPRQVRIAVKILNVNHDNNMSIGVGITSFPFTQFGLEGFTNGFASPFSFGDGASIPSRSSGLFAGTLQTDGRAFLEALEEAADVEILATPDVLALDGEMARIQVGERLGFRVTTTTQTATLESVEFLDVGTVLEVTPTISNDGYVRLDIHPKISNGSISSTGLPSESTTEISTSMIVRDGQTVVLGGLLNATRQRIKSQIPFLGDIPFIGKLFGKRTWIDDKSEVVVLITPHILGELNRWDSQERIDAAEERWGQFGRQGLIRGRIPFPKTSPTLRWNNRVGLRDYHHFDVDSPRTSLLPGEVRHD